MDERTILFTCAVYGGGIGKMLNYVLNICLREFKHVMIIFREQDYAIPKGVEIIEIPKSSTLMPVWRFRQIRDMRRKIKLVRPDIVCCFGSEQAVMVAVALIGLGNIKLVQADRSDPYMRKKIWSIFVKWAFNCADRCVFQLPKQGLWYGKKIIEKSIIIPNAVLNLNDVAQCTTRTRRPFVVGVGRFVYEKKFEDLIKAFNVIHEKHPEYNLVIYGDGPYRRKYEQIINELNLQDCVKLPGYVNNVIDAIKDASVYVLSSLYEGMPNSLMEAMAAGVPTVSTDCSPGGPEFLTDYGRRGLLVPVNDSDAIADAVCRIIENPKLSLELSYKGKEIIDLFSEDKISVKWINLFHSI